jgi:hypothetical protein
MAFHSKHFPLLYISFVYYVGARNVPSSVVAGLGVEG